jgi:hypothetical protein
MSKGRAPKPLPSLPFVFLFCGGEPDASRDSFLINARELSSLSRQLFGKQAIVLAFDNGITFASALL